MHLTVGYLATPTGDDGVALASALAKTFDAEVDVVLVVREEMPDGHPGRAEYQKLLINRGKDWISRAVGALADRGVNAGSTVLVGESFAETLIDFAEKKDSDLIVIGGARDGVFGGHVIGSVTGALLHCVADPGRARTARLSRGRTRHRHRRHGRRPHQARRRQPASFALTLASAANLPIRMVSLVSAENLSQADSASEVRQIQVTAAEENLVRAARALPDAPEIESLVADGLTLESALKKLNWNDTDVLVVGSSRFAAPRRIFLGSTAARILAGTDAPVVVVPRDDA